MKCEQLREPRMDVLYGEADPETIRQVRAHEATCAECRQETAELRRVRRDPQAWKAPSVRRMAAPAPSPPLARPYLAAAAALLLAAGAAISLSGSELRYEDGRMSFRLGRTDADAEIARRLAEQETRHRREIEALKASLALAV